MRSCNKKIKLFDVSIPEKCPFIFVVWQLLNLQVFVVSVCLISMIYKVISLREGEIQQVTFRKNMYRIAGNFRKK